MSGDRNLNLLSRRAFLKSSGVSIALPFMASLPGLSRSMSAATGMKVGGGAAGVSKRMVLISTGLGMHPGSFFPREFGENFAPSPVLQPLMAHRGDFTVFSHMDHPSIFSKHGGIKSLYNGSLIKKSAGERIVSVDQVAASHVGYATRFPSAHISLGGGNGGSWTASGIKVREEGSPFNLFQKMFVNDSEAAKKKVAAELEHQGSILDLVRDQAKSFERKVNQADKDKLEEYLTAVREAEERLQGIKRWQDREKSEVEFDTSVRPHGSMDYATLSPLMYDLLFLAIQSDSSRVLTAGYGMHNKRIELEGVSSGYHSLSHHGNRDQKVKELQIIEKFYMQEMARFITKLKEAQTDGRSLFDETMVFFGSGISDASRHSNRNLPIVLAGGGFKHKGHYDAKQKHNKRQTPLNNLYTTMLQNFGVKTEAFNDATGDMNHVLT